MNVTFTGTHANNRTDSDVTDVEILFSNTPFIIHQLFTTFPNLVRLDIYSSNLETIIIPPEAQLLRLGVDANKLLRIESDSLRNQTQLLYFSASRNQITAIDEDVFEDLHSLENLVLNDNRIQELTPRTLAPLTRAYSINFERNLLTTIDEGIFSLNTNLQYLLLQYNQIDKIHPRTFSDLRNNLVFVNLYENQCVSRSFSLNSQDDLEWMTINNLLQRCFSNFFGGDPEVRNVTMQFRGPLTIYDDFGNMIARFQ